jgi:hypothetical protein
VVWYTGELFFYLFFIYLCYDYIGVSFMKFERGHVYYFWNKAGYVDSIVVDTVAMNGIAFMWRGGLFVAVKHIADKRFFASPNDVPEYKALASEKVEVTSPPAAEYRYRPDADTVVVYGD